MRRMQLALIGLVATALLVAWAGLCQDRAEAQGPAADKPTDDTAKVKLFGQETRVSATTAPDDAAGPAVVTALGLQICAAPVGPNEDPLRAFNGAEAGVSVSLLTTVSRGTLLDFDAEASALGSFVDDTGTDLLKADKKTSRGGGFGMFARTGKDGRSAVCEAFGSTLPAKGATQVQLSAALAFSYSPSGQRQTVRLENVKLAKGTKVKVGSLEATIEKAGKPEWGDDAMEVELQSSQKLTALASVAFLGADGKPIESRVTGSGRMTIMGVSTYSQSYSLKQKADSATLVIEYWADIQTLKVPANLAVGLGL